MRATSRSLNRKQNLRNSQCIWSFVPPMAVDAEDNTSIWACPKWGIRIVRKTSPLEALLSSMDMGCFEMSLLMFLPGLRVQPDN